MILSKHPTLVRYARLIDAGYLMIGALGQQALARAEEPNH